VTFIMRPLPIMPPAHHPAHLGEDHVDRLPRERRGVAVGPANTAEGTLGPESQTGARPGDEGPRRAEQADEARGR